MKEKCMKSIMFLIIELIILIFFKVQANDHVLNVQLHPSLHIHHSHHAQLDKSHAGPTCLYETSLMRPVHERFFPNDIFNIVMKKKKSTPAKVSKCVFTIPLSIAIFFYFPRDEMRSIVRDWNG